ncbi:MAG: hypothetical protein ACI8PV_001885, partial [Dinoroseobacter sp.]
GEGASAAEAVVVSKDLSAAVIVEVLSSDLMIVS